jgi:hypothetical protein
MQFYKKVFLTLSAAGTMVSCVPVSMMTYPVQAKVVEKTTYIYLDSDNDGLVDSRMYISGSSDKNNQCYFRDYLMLGDTIKYRTTKDNPVELDADLYRNVILDSVNCKSAADLKRIYEINFIRSKIGHDKKR